MSEKSVVAHAVRILVKQRIGKQVIKYTKEEKKSSDKQLVNKNGTQAPKKKMKCYGDWWTFDEIQTTKSTFMFLESLNKIFVFVEEKYRTEKMMEPMNQWMKSRTSEYLPIILLLLSYGRW